jgi:DNA primase
VSKNTFRCFVCGASGGTIDLVMRYLHLDFLEATKWLENIDHSPFLRPDGSKRPSAERSIDHYDAQKAFDASRYNLYFERPWLSDEARRFLFEERRLDERVVRWCRLTSWKDKQGIPWLQSPYYEREGKLVGVQNRNLIKGATPRFRFPSGSQCSIYNLPVVNLLRPGETLFIAEGCSDCWSLLSAGHKAIAIPSATLLSKKDVNLLQALSSELSVRYEMWPDRDEPGERLFMQLKEVLPALEHHQLPPGCKDYSEYYLSKLRGQASG